MRILDAPLAVADQPLEAAVAVAQPDDAGFSRDSFGLQFSELAAAVDHIGEFFRKRDFQFHRSDGDLPFRSDRERVPQQPVVFRPEAVSE